MFSVALQGPLLSQRDVDPNFSQIFIKYIII